MSTHPDLAGLPRTAAARAARLRAIRTGVERDDAELAAAWRGRSDAEHAAAGARLSDLAAEVRRRHHARPEDAPLVFPSLRALRDRRRATG